MAKNLAKSLVGPQRLTRGRYTNTGGRSIVIYSTRVHIYCLLSVFIYSMPGYECSIKERMLYSSCRNALVDQIGQLNITIDKKMEVDSGSELTEENIFNEIHPKKESNVSAKVTRPAPPSRGKRRMIKVPQ